MAGVDGDAETAEPVLLEDELFVIRSRARRAGARAVRTQAVVAVLPVLLLATVIVVSVVLMWVGPA